MKRQGQLIVSFIHSNYLVKNGGTEKFLSELSKKFIYEGFSHLCFFPINKIKSLNGTGFVGVIFNDKYVGITLATDMHNEIEYYLCKYNLNLNSLQIQHLRYYSIENILNCLNRFSANIIVYLHDFYFICCSCNLIDSSGKFCGEDGFSQEKCISCNLYKKECIHSTSIVKFLDSIGDRVIRYISPSLYVKKVFEKNKPEIAHKIIIRPHLELEGEKRLNPINGKIKLAFLGRQTESKGYFDWLKLIKKLNDKFNNVYDFYYLGIDRDEVDVVHNVFVSTVEQGNEAMIKGIAENGINCAFLWPQCPETYSYVYYELLNSGVFIITNTHSGNIMYEVEKNKNGICFTNLSEAVNWFMSPNDVINKINNYRRDTIIPEKIYPNVDISMCISNNFEEHKHINNKKTIRQFISVLYKVRYRRYHL